MAAWRDRHGALTDCYSYGDISVPSTATNIGALSGGTLGTANAAKIPIMDLKTTL